MSLLSWPNWISPQPNWQDCSRTLGYKQITDNIGLTSLSSDQDEDAKQDIAAEHFVEILCTGANLI